MLSPQGEPHLGGLLQPVSRLADANVQHQLGDADVPHVPRVLAVRRLQARQRERAARSAGGLPPGPSSRRERRVRRRCRRRRAMLQPTIFAARL